VLVVHLDPTHISLMPELLQKRTKMPVCQVKDGTQILPNHVYVIPPNKDLTILHGRLHLMELSQPRGVNLPIDTFFRSLAQDQEGNAVCIILSGTGTDGTLGVKAIKGALGMVMVQDEKSARYEGMPRSAIATGLVDYVLEPKLMPQQLIKYTQHATQKDAPRIPTVDGPVPSALQKIFVVLRARTNHDFSLYKKNTICRRIERRMNVHQIDDITDYVRFLQESDREAGILFKELLIGVTNFFRDPKAFEILQTQILPKLLSDKPDDYAVRVWVPGCGSGEEAYSVAILLHETMEQLGRHYHIQIFGTDIDEDAIAVARSGNYPESIMADVSAVRMKRYFVKEDNGQYRVKKQIREMLVFAPQNVIKDPPFTKLDLLCCRNLLIYLGPELQKKLLPIFHYSLKLGGILFLGSSENHFFFRGARLNRLLARSPRSVRPSSRCCSFDRQGPLRCHSDQMRSDRASRSSGRSWRIPSRIER
jgi:two-component system, chemotaxis family, CheB/CheR fusion protein